MSSGGSKGGMASIPAASRKMVQSLKEIVNCPEHEIYAMLKECNMDPNDTVSRLLSQDPFHEVKSKKEKKKELKDTSEPRSRGFSTSSNRGSRGGANRYDGRGGSTQSISSESGVSRGKPAYKKESGANELSSSSNIASGFPGNNVNRHPTSFSDSFAGENKVQTAGTVDSFSSPAQSSPGFQPAWVGVPGQVSLADIVKRGKPKANASPNTSASVSSHQSGQYPFASAPRPSELNNNFGSSQQSASKISEMVHESDVTGSHHVSHQEWSLVEPSSGSGSSVLDPSANSEAYADASISSNFQVDRTNWHLNSQSVDPDGIKGDTSVENHNVNGAGPASASSRQVQENCSENTSHFEDDSFDNTNSYQPHGHTFEHQEGNDGSSQLSVPNYSVSSVEDVTTAVSSVAANMHQLNLQKEEVRAPPAEANPAVIIPDHLQIPNADCSHLSFGSFGAGLNATYPGSFTAKSLNNNLEESVPTNATSSGHPENRNPEYFGDEHLRSTSEGEVAARTGGASYDTPSSQPEIMKQDSGETTHGHHYAFPTSVPGYTVDNNAQPNASFSYAQTNSQMQNNAPLSSVMQGYSNSLQGNLLASMVQPGRETDLPYSSFLAAQSMPTKYSTGLSSISGPTSSMPEITKPSVLSMPHPTPQALPGTGIATGPALPQHLLHPYSQPTLPLGHFANMYSFPIVPHQSYTYVPSAYQQAYAGNSSYHQSPAAGMKYSLQQYKNSIPGSSLPQPAALASAYGGFGSSANIPGNFQLNPSTTPASTTIGYDDVINSQYKDSSNQFVPLQQNDSTVWVHGPGSRTVSVPPNSYYNFQGQNQQHNGYRQGQQSSQQQHYAGLGYPNFYHSQAGVSQEHQQQTANDGALNGSQIQPTKQSHQMWQPNYQ